MSTNRHKQSPASGGLLRSLSLHTIVVITALFVAVPLVYAVLGGFKTTRQLSSNPIGLPDPWMPENYGGILASGSFWHMLWNSTYIAVLTTLVVVAVSALAAFVFARFAFRGREALFTMFAAGLMFPFAVAILPLFVLLRMFGLLDNPLGVILPQAAFGMPMTIIILRGFFRAIPGEIEEAAILDGCTPFGFFWRILLPMARPAIATVSVLAVVNSWNQFMLPLVVFSDDGLFTIPLGVQQFQGQYATDVARVMAYIVVAMLPALGFYAVAERQLVSGLTAGAVKG
ncbi:MULTISPECIES: carbohydrate ABC transporter permease [Microbispora]|uniref:Carbohydrate ABC transporter permease n=3 Tax=Microbispora TaxID=2005 RepID=A0ABY3M1Q0_9ACTN|nr:MULTISPECIES: carbohydrate ABC transporter permease [Microbispora]GLW26176.1 sugar ABC transporter permease [Microbispora amethystogenes]MBO4273010.1 ABC transporter permease subunit [Microbispora triticiradicis]RGA01165.1 carbohydrate ABC transporter permease [Microbispora triticiradicis]TLP57105.1 carbohydrate ABC transporter permease [Microbispora fusca]TYB64092.1 carbohydrate ABC transporter permease [Microbispora tritici]